MDKEYLAAALSSVAIFEQQQMAAFACFLENVERLGSALGLTEAKGRDLVDNHLVDSLLVYPYLRQQSIKRLCDVGSGAGFPGLALAIALPNLQITLVERMQKRASFLQMMVRKLNLNNVVVLNTQIQEVNERFDLITFRALTQMSAKLVKGLLRVAPKIMAYKGRLSVVQAEALALNLAGYRTCVMELQHEGLSKERHILEISVS